MTKKKFDILKQLVLDRSESEVWDTAKDEWDVIGYENNVEVKGVCVCTQDDLRHQYTIRNRITRKELYPIGSVCITHFGSSSMTEQMKTLTDVERIGERTVRCGKYKGRKFKDVPKEYIGFLRRCECLTTKTFIQLVEYDDLRSDSSSSLSQR